ncbi:DUF2264 domain-containing protein [Pontiellaceae bacterium B12219]|nr:DUF2264 domain-containing protein [Pontiellaceae bacterium B12219]
MMSSYESWVLAAEQLLKPLVDRMQPGAAFIPLEGMASNHGIGADELEAFARPCLLASHWLAAQGGEASGFSRDEVARWFREGLVAGTDPKADTYWGAITNYHQHSVESGALVLALEMARDWLWTPLTADGKLQVLKWFRTVRGVGLHRNNHLFFGVFPLCFTIREGLGSTEDQALVLQWMDILESMYLGNGWFLDGMNETVDHYNAYAFHYYGLWWGRLYGDMDPARAERWRDYAKPFLHDYSHFFAASGENVPFGRSLIYRFAASAPFGLAHLCKVRELSAGMSRKLCTKNLEFFLDRLPAGEPLSIGWVDDFPALAEAYSCAGSPYWAAKAFAPLLIEPADPFWTEAEEPLPAEGADYSRPIPIIGMVVRSIEGEVELLNGESAICPGNTAFGTYKWGKTSFRTGVGFEVKSPEGEFPRDAALTAETEDGTVFGRHSTHVLKCTENEVAMAYVLGDKVTLFGLQVESRIWLRGGWQLQLHKYDAHQKARLTVGGYSLPVGDETHFSKLQAVAGWDSSDLIRHSGAARTHMLADASSYPILQTEWVEGEGALVCLSYCGKHPSRDWKIVSADASGVVLEKENEPAWEICFD